MKKYLVMKSMEYLNEDPLAPSQGERARVRGEKRIQRNPALSLTGR